MHPTRDILVFGDFDMPVADDTPVNFFILRYPSKGIPWRTLMSAVRKFLREQHGEKARNGRIVAPYFNVDGDVPEWDTTKFPRYVYDASTLQRVSE